MIPTFIISLREFLEAFLIAGVFLGISRKLNLRREKEIIIAILCGTAIALLIPILVFILGEKASVIFTEKNAEMLEGYLMIFSGFFIAYVVFSLHKFFTFNRSKQILTAHEKLQTNMFDVSLFLTIVFFIIREGFEIALFTATVSLFAEFMENLTGLLAGFAVSSLIGFLTFFAYLKFPIGKIFKITEYMIVLLGAAFVANGANELLEVYANIHLSRVLAISLPFIPQSSTFLGHLIKSMAGLERNFSLIKLAIMTAYIGIVYLLFLKKKKHHA